MPQSTNSISQGGLEAIEYSNQYIKSCISFNSLKKGLIAQPIEISTIQRAKG